MNGSNTDRAPCRSALTHFAELRVQLSGRRPAVFLDYDGTLTPIVAQPELATLAPGMRATLRRLAESVTVAVISGRLRADVQNLVKLDTVYYAGNHGLEVTGPTGTAIQQEFARDYLDDVRQARDLLNRQLSGVEYLLLEDKRFSLSVHYRLVDPDRIVDIERVVDSVVVQLPRLQKRLGKKVFELRPDIDWDKGKVVLWLLQALALDNDLTLPIYIGDDATDEDAFLALRQRGIGILVGETADSAACYTLRDPDQVQDFLEWLATTLEKDDK